MSSMVDERVVQMSFDNNQFEKGVSQTIDSLNELDKSLEKTSNNEYFEQMETGITNVAHAFSISGTIITGILLSIGQTINGYLIKGLRELRSGITSGFSEYNTQMDATQTILANVKDEGKDIGDVTAALDELNTYADKTIYNFTEMTRNIGMFTAAGSSLDDSVDTIKGLANAAALVGANASTAARAWYQVSQAMAAGTFKLMDWRSLEISNIAGEGFKSVLTEVARKDGVAIDSMIKKYGSLRDTLREGWLTSKRFTEAMSILTNELTEDQLEQMGYTEEQIKLLKGIAQEAEDAAVKVKTFGQLVETTKEAIGSGWAVTFRTIIGDFEKARKFFTRISITLNDLIDRMSDYRNKYVDIVWNGIGLNNKTSPANNFKKTIDNLLAIFSTFVGAVRAGFDNIFPWERIRDGMQKVSDRVQKFTESLVVNDKQLDKDKANRSNLWDLDVVNDNIKNLIKIFRGFFAGVDIIWITIRDTISWVISQIPGLNNFFDNLKDGNTSLIGSLANLMDKITKIRDIMEKLNLIPNILSLIKKDIINIINTNPLINFIVNTIILAVNGVISLNNALKNMNISPFAVAIGAIKLVAAGISSVVQWLSEGLDAIGRFVTGNNDFSFLDFITEQISNFIKALQDIGSGTRSASSFIDAIKEKLAELAEFINNNPFIKATLQIGTIVGAVIAFVGVLDGLLKSIMEKNPIGLLGESFLTFSEAMKKNGTVHLLDSLSGAILKVTLSIIALAVAFETMPEGMNRAIATMGALILVLTILVKILSGIGTSISAATITKGGPTEMLVGFLNGLLRSFSQAASAVLSLLKVIGVVMLIGTVADSIVKIASSIILLSTIDSDAMMKSAAVVTIMMLSLGVITAFMQMYAKDLDTKNAAALFAIAGIMAIFGLIMKSLADSIVALSGLENMGPAVIAIGALLVILSATIVEIEKNAKGMTVSKSLIRVFASLALMFAAIGLSIAAIVAVSSLITSTNQIISIVIGVVSMLGMILIAVKAMEEIMLYIKQNNITETRITQAMAIVATMAGSLSVIAISFSAAAAIISMSGAGFTDLISIISVIAIAIGAMFGIIVLLGNLKIDATTLGMTSVLLISMALMIVGISAALAMLNGIKLDSSVLVTLSVMVVAIGLVTTILGVLAVLGGEGITEIVAVAFVALAAYFLAIGGMLLMISQAMLNMQQVVKNFFDALMYLGNTENAMQVVEAIQNAAQLLIDATPALKELFIAAGKAYVSVVGGFLEGFATGIGGLVTSIGNMILVILNSVTSWVMQNAPAIQTTLVNVFKAIIMIALVALNVAFFDILPTILFFIMNIFTQILGFIVGLIVDLGAQVNKMWGDMWAAILGEDNPLTQYFRDQEQLWKDARDTLDTVVQDMVGFLNGLTDAVMNGMLLVNDMFGYFSDVSTETTETVVDNTDKVVDASEAEAEALEASSMTTSDAYESQAEASNESTATQTANFFNLGETLTGGSQDLFGTLSGLATNFFGMQTGNTEDYYGFLLGTQNEYQVNAYNSDVAYLTKTSSLWTEYYGDAGKYVNAYYEGIAEADAAQKAHDMNALAAATTKMQNAQKSFQKEGISLSDLLGDNIEYDKTSGKIISKITKPVYDSWENMFSDLSDMWNSYEPGDVDTSAYTADYKSPSKSVSGTDTSKLQEELKNRNDAINKADSEIHPKDLTPTIDLDQLKSEVNQANGIMTGSLLAAQNAAIGDYINTDSELNPFLKDRYQNTYNFTQNNYSPKALSRIDIYRQTQNQLRLSRGM